MPLRAHPLWPLLILALAWSPGEAFAANDPDVVPGQVVVRFDDGVSAQRRAAVRADADATAIESLGVPGTQLLRIDADRSPYAAAAELERRAGVRYAEPNFVYRLSVVPNDAQFGQLWGLDNTGQTVNGAPGATPDADIDAPEAWDTTTGSSAVTVGVTDSGVDYLHPDLAQNIAPGGADFVTDGDNDPRDTNGHGTHVAGTIGARANDGFGVAGVNWTTGLVPIQVCGTTGSCASADIAEGFDHAGDIGVRVVNGSFGGPNFSQLISNAVSTHPNTLYVVSAGNDGTNNDSGPVFPCNLEHANLVCVAATTFTDALASFSNFGATSVDLAAPGASILSDAAFDQIFADFFGSLGAWTTAGGTWTATSEASVSGSSATDSAGGDYANTPASNPMQKTTNINLAGRERCFLDFRLKLEVAAGDAFQVSFYDGTMFDGVLALSGTTGADFDPFSIPIAPEHTTATFKVRFNLSSNGDSNVGDGAHVDNLVVRCGSDYGPTDFLFFNGTSMASPHVAGIVALMFAAKPDATVAEARAALLGSVEPKPALAGKTVTGGRANARMALDALLGAQPPVPVTGQPPVEIQPPPVALSASTRLRRQRLRNVLRNGLLVDVASTRDGTALVDLFVGSGTVRRLELARSVRVGRRRAAVKAGTTRVRVRLTRRARSRLKRARRLRLSVRTSVTSGAETRRARAKALTLR